MVYIAKSTNVQMLPDLMVNSVMRQYSETYVFFIHLIIVSFLCGTQHSLQWFVMLQTVEMLTSLTPSNHKSYNLLLHLHNNFSFHNTLIVSHVNEMHLCCECRSAWPNTALWWAGVRSCINAFAVDTGGFVIYTKHTLPHLYDQEQQIFTAIFQKSTAVLLYINILCIYSLKL